MGHCGFTGSETTILMALSDAVNRLVMNHPACQCTTAAVVVVPL